jgi:hypothetical protein
VPTGNGGTTKWLIQNNFFQFIAARRSESPHTRSEWPLAFCAAQDRTTSGQAPSCVADVGREFPAVAIGNCLGGIRASIVIADGSWGPRGAGSRRDVDTARLNFAVTEVRRSFGCEAGASSFGATNVWCLYARSPLPSTLESKNWMPALSRLRPERPATRLCLFRR